MIYCAVRIPGHGWRDALEAAGDLTLIRDLEIPADILLTESDARSVAERLGLRPTVVTQLLPDGTSRYLAETPMAGRSDVADALRTSLGRCLDAGARYVTLDLGLGRLGPDGAGLRERIGLIQSLMPVAGAENAVVAVHVRVPAEDPRGHERDHAANIVHDVMHPSCRLCVNVVPAELADTFDIESYVRTHYHAIGVLRFHYIPALGLGLSHASQRTWATALQRHRFRGAVVFCPEVRESEALPRIFAEAEDCARVYGPA